MTTKTEIPPFPAFPAFLLGAILSGAVTLLSLGAYYEGKLLELNCAHYDIYTGRLTYDQRPPAYRIVQSGVNKDDGSVWYTWSEPPTP